MLLSSIASGFDKVVLGHVVEQPFPYIISTIIFIAITVISRARSQEKGQKIPFYGYDGVNANKAIKRWVMDAFNLLREAHNQFPDKVFQVMTTEGPQIVIPPNLINEIKMLPDNVLPSAIGEVFAQTRHTTVGGPIEKQHRFYHMISSDLPKNLAKIIPGVKEETEISIPLEFPNCNDWTALKVFPRVVRFVSRVSGRAFIGPSVNHDERWIQISVDYTGDLFKGARDIRQWKPFLRPIAKYFVPAIRRVWVHNNVTTELLKPIFQKRNQDEKLDGYEKPNDTIEWFRDIISEKEKNDYKYQALIQLAIGAAAINTTSQTVSNCIFDLAAYPEFIPLLRDEAQSILGGLNGEWTIERLGQLKMLDSFMKESQRLSSSALTFQRQVLKEIRLSDGTILPKGSLIFFPSAAKALDPAIYDEPEKFDGLRFYRQRQAAKEEHKHQFVSTGPTQMQFGTGRHACSGRWFASHSIKIMLVCMLLEYDMKLKEGEERPKSIHFETNRWPNPNAEVLFRSRKH